MKTLPRKKRWEEKLLFSKTRLKNCVNILTCEQMSYECTNGPFKETYGEMF